MTDIVERLYEMADDITPELAAQEITRLLAERDAMLATLKWIADGGRLEVEYERIARAAITKAEGRTP